MDGEQRLIKNEKKWNNRDNGVCPWVASGSSVLVPEMTFTSAGRGIISVLRFAFLPRGWSRVLDDSSPHLSIRRISFLLFFLPWSRIGASPTDFLDWPIFLSRLHFLFWSSNLIFFSPLCKKENLRFLFLFFFFFFDNKEIYSLYFNEKFEGV